MSRWYKMAKEYYPDKWNRAMIDRLLAEGKITQEEYDDIVGVGA